MLPIVKIDEDIHETFSTFSVSSHSSQALSSTHLYITNEVPVYSPHLNFLHEFLLSSPNALPSSSHFLRWILNFAYHSAFLMPTLLNYTGKFLIHFLFLFLFLLDYNNTQLIKILLNFAYGLIRG